MQRVDSQSHLWKRVSKSVGSVCERVKGAHVFVRPTVSKYIPAVYVCTECDNRSPPPLTSSTASFISSSSSSCVQVTLRWTTTGQ